VPIALAQCGGSLRAQARSHNAIPSPPAINRAESINPHNHIARLRCLVINIVEVLRNLRFDQRRGHREIGHLDSFARIEVEHAPSIVLADDFKNEAVVDVEFHGVTLHEREADIVRVVGCNLIAPQIDTDQCGLEKCVSRVLSRGAMRLHLMRYAVGGRTISRRILTCSSVKLPEAYSSQTMRVLLCMSSGCISPFRPDNSLFQIGVTIPRMCA
jgi:hypothetical protein